MMLAKISSDMPLPTPRSVICSPSHMMNTLPVVSVRMVINTKPRPGFGTKLPAFSRPIAMNIDCTVLSNRVRYRVYIVIFLRPSSPSFCSFANGS